MDSSCFEILHTILPSAIEALYNYIKSEKTEIDLTNHYIVCGYEECTLVGKFDENEYRVIKQINYHSHKLGMDLIDEQFTFDFNITKNEIQDLYILKKLNEKLIFEMITVKGTRDKPSKITTFKIKMKRLYNKNKDTVLTTD